MDSPDSDCGRGEWRAGRCDRFRRVRAWRFHHDVGRCDDLRRESAGRWQLAVAFDSSFTTPRLCGPVRDLDLGTPSGPAAGPGNGDPAAVLAGSRMKWCGLSRCGRIRMGRWARTDSWIRRMTSGIRTRSPRRWSRCWCSYRREHRFHRHRRHGPNPRVELYDADDTLLGTFALNKSECKGWPWSQKEGGRAGHASHNQRRYPGGTRRA